MFPWAGIVEEGERFGGGGGRRWRERVEMRRYEAGSAARELQIGKKNNATGK